jgi:hypothetical protein
VRPRCDGLDRLDRSFLGNGQTLSDASGCCRFRTTRRGDRGVRAPHDAAGARWHAHFEIVLERA